MATCSDIPDIQDRITAVVLGLLDEQYMTQVGLAKVLGIDQSCVSRSIHGGARPRQWTVRDIDVMAAFFGCSPARFFDADVVA